MAEENLQSNENVDSVTEQKSEGETSESQIEENQSPEESGEQNEVAKQEEKEEELKKQAKSDKAWKQMRIDTTTTKRENKELKAKLADYESKKAVNNQPVFNQQPTPQSQNFAYVADPVTGQQIQLGMTFEELAKLNVAPQQTQVQNVPVNQVNQQQTQEPIYSKEVIEKAADSRKRNGVEVEHNINELLAMGVLNTSLIEAAVEIADDYGQNGIDFLNDIGKTQQGKETLAEIASKTSPAKRIAAMTKLIDNMAARKNDKLHSRSARQPEPLNENGSFKKGLFNLASEYDRQK